MKLVVLHIYGIKYWNSYLVQREILLKIIWKLQHYHSCQIDSGLNYLRVLKFPVWWYKPIAYKTKRGVLIDARKFVWYDKFSNVDQR